MLNKLVTPQLTLLNKAFQSEGFDLRFVGGCVRDLLLDQTPKDVDLCTNATPDEMLALAARHNFKTVPTGLSHGTLTFVLKGEPYEVTTLRVDTETDGRHAKVEFTRSFERDAERRDLTFNAMSMDFEGQVFDYFSGQEDLRDNVVRFVGSAEERVAEDYLRVLRFFRFAARFDSAMPESDCLAVSSNKALTGLTRISVERVWAEMSKLLTSKGRVAVVERMAELGVLTALQVPYTGRTDALVRATSPVTALASMTSLEHVDALDERWKFSKAERNMFRFVQHNLSKSNQEWVENQLVNNTPMEWVLAVLEVDDRADLMEYAMAYRTPVFPVTASMVMERLRLDPGPEVGQWMARFRTTWVLSRFTTTADDLFEAFS